MGLAELVQLLQTLAPLFQALTPLAAAVSKVGAEAFADTLARNADLSAKLSTAIDQLTALEGAQRGMVHQLQVIETLNRAQDGRLDSTERDLSALRVAVAALSANGGAHVGAR